MTFFQQSCVEGIQVTISRYGGPEAFLAMLKKFNKTPKDYVEDVARTFERRGGTNNQVLAAAMRSKEVANAVGGILGLV